MFGWFSRPTPEQVQQERERILEYLRTKLPALRKLKRKSHDNYGVFIESRWAFKKELFVKSAIRNELPDLRAHKWQDIRVFIDDVMDARMEPSAAMSGHDYEAIVASELRHQGWAIEQTAGSGDHGVDLVATKEDLRVAIQCKRFKGRVGTAAVQAVVGGSAFYQATRTAVVTTGTFTPAAIELASVTRTALLEHGDLPRLHAMLLGK